MATATNHHWTKEDMPNLTGKVVIVTGANSGLGYQVARAMAYKGATVVLACRDAAKGEQALQSLRKEHPNAKLELMTLDLADLTSIRSFAESFSQKYSTLDILCNNAGVMAIPYRQTAQGFEMQFGTNHLGHFALTGLLLPTILKTPGQPRIVTTSSILHRNGQINFADLASKNSYNRGAAYSQSKLANLLFAYELQRQLTANGSNSLSLAAHPGYAATNLQTTGSLMDGAAFKVRVSQFANSVFAQSAAMGALPTLYAATASGVKGGEYFGPAGFMELRGYPKAVKSNQSSYDLELAKKLWAVSEELTGVSFNLIPSPVK